MAVGKFIYESGGHAQGFVDETSALADESEIAFFTFFNGNCATIDEVFVQGAWDFSFHIASPAAPFIDSPSKKVAMEIGYGGGRILASAATHFEHVIGVDVHKNSELVRSELSRRGVENFTLFETDGKTFPVSDGTIDFAYSFIVMQHMELVSIFEKNISEIARCLAVGGVGILYFGRVSRRSLNSDSRWSACFDRIMETTPFLPDYVENPAHVNETNLLVSSRHARKVCSLNSMEILDQGFSRKNVPDGAKRYGGQTYLVVRKKSGA